MDEDTGDNNNLKGENGNEITKPRACEIYDVIEILTNYSTYVNYAELTTLNLKLTKIVDFETKSYKVL